MCSLQVHAQQVQVQAQVQAQVQVQVASAFQEHFISDVHIVTEVFF